MPDILGIYLQGLERHGVAYTDGEGRLFVSLPEHLPFEVRDDSGVHVCKGGETLLELAIGYYRDSYANPIDMVDVIAEFQENRIVDRSVPLEAGRIVLIPSTTYNEEIAFGEDLSEYPQHV